MLLNLGYDCDRIRETLYMKMAHLTLKMPSKIVADDSLISLLFFREKRKRFYISCESSAKADDSHEISSLIFSEK